MYSLLIADRIAQLLDNKEIKPKQLADLMHKSPSQITAWLKGKHNFTLSTIESIEQILGEPLITITSEHHTQPQTSLTTRKSGTYKRSCPSKHNTAECANPALTDSQRDAKRNLPQVQAFQSATQTIHQDFADPARKALWTLVWNDANVSAGKRGSYTDSKMRNRVSKSLRSFAIQQVLKGKRLSHFFPNLQSLTSEEVLAKERSRRDQLREERNAKQRLARQQKA